MTPTGWTVMVLSLGFVLGLLVFCFYRVLSRPQSEEHIHGPLDNEPDDIKQNRR